MLGGLTALALGAEPPLGADATGADDPAVHGRLLLGDALSFAPGGSLEAAAAGRQSNVALGDLRLMWQPKKNGWSLDLAYELTAEAGPGLRLTTTEQALLVPPPTTLLSLTGVLARGRDSLVTGRIDRLSITYAAPSFVARIGRQALTWGAGQFFHPLDLVDPFAPEAIDTEYKPGVDMAYGQLLFSDGSDLQLIAVPRRAPVGGVTWNASTIAARYHRTFGKLGAAAEAARDHGDWTAGFTLSGPLRGAAWNLELAPTWEAGGRTRVSALANVSLGFSLLRRNATAVAEYYHNGFGAPAGAPFAALPPDLKDRLSRGQLFDTGRDYLAAGVSLEWTPLLTLSPALIVNLDDGSVYPALQAVRSLNNDTDLYFGVQAPLGARGTEFGGLPLAQGTNLTLAPPMIGYVQLRRHF
ncbi:MAG TPA: hypothetical protein VGS12_07450 [Caulobacteraceae bacterium]|nr:hypothetical protein [Caulobacteraceae bacterium]